jgi:putative flippase GtrA
MSQDSRPVSRLRGLIDRLLGLYRELGKFGTIGAVTYVIDVTIYNLILAHTDQTILASSIATVIAATCAFIGNRFWTWRHRERSGMAREYSLYFGVNLVGLGISAACLGVSHYWLGSYWEILTTQLADNVSGKVIGVGLASIFRFWAYRRFVFRAEPSTKS